MHAYRTVTPPLTDSKPMPRMMVVVLPVIGPICGEIDSIEYGGPTTSDTRHVYTSSYQRFDQPPKTIIELVCSSKTIGVSARGDGVWPITSGRLHVFEPLSSTTRSLMKVPCGLPPSIRSPEFPPKTNIFQYGTEKTPRAEWFQRFGPHASPDAVTDLDQVAVARSRI
jgi:hypothetical protein